MQPTWQVAAVDQGACAVNQFGAVSGGLAVGHGVHVSKVAGDVDGGQRCAHGARRVRNEGADSGFVVGPRDAHGDGLLAGRACCVFDGVGEGVGQGGAAGQHGLNSGIALGDAVAVAAVGADLERAIGAGDAGGR